MASGKGIDWIKAGATIVGSVAAASRAMLEYRKFRRDQESLEYTRGMQRKAWQQVVDGELSSAKVGDVEIKAPTDKTAGASKTRRTTTSGAAANGESSRTVVSTTTTLVPNADGGGKSDKSNGLNELDEAGADSGTDLD